jgi:hypothetical protein
MSRIPGRSGDAGSAFDFDVVTDAPPPPSRRPDPTPPAPASAARPAEIPRDGGPPEQVRRATAVS